MELNITAPAEKLLLRLWESLEKSTIGLLRPWQLKRIAKAEAASEKFKILTSEQAKQDAINLKRGKVYFDIESGKLLPIAEDTEISTEKMLISNEYVKILCKSTNVANALKIAIEQLEKEQEPITEEPINQDWLNEWGEHAGFVSDESMQQLWGNILAGEIKKPGTFSLRTMQFLRTLLKTEAELIHKYLNYNMTSIIINNIVGHTDDPSFPFHDIMKLNELGILVADFLRTLSTRLSLDQKNNRTGRYVKTLRYYSWLLIIESDKENISLNLPIIQPTQLGLELAQLGNYTGDEDYLDLVAKKTLTLNNALTVYKTQSFTFEDNNISWSNAQQITLED